MNSEELKKIIEQVNDIGIPDMEIMVTKAKTAGVVGTHIDLQDSIRREQMRKQRVLNEELHYNGNTEQAGHMGIDRSTQQDIVLLADIDRSLDGYDLPPVVREDVRAICSSIIEVKGHVRGIPLATYGIPKGELSHMVAGCSLISSSLQMLSAENIIIGPIAVGTGHVMTNKGMELAPSQETELLLCGVPTESGYVGQAYCTPTAAGSIRYHATSFGLRPRMVVSDRGVGIGSDRISRYPHCVRAFMGDLVDGC